MPSLYAVTAITFPYKHLPVSLEGHCVTATGAELSTQQRALPVGLDSSRVWRDVACPLTKEQAARGPPS